MQENDKPSLNEMVVLPNVEMKVGMETTSMQNVEILDCESEKEECYENENTSVAWLSDVKSEFGLSVAVQMPESDINCEKGDRIEPPSTRLRGEGQNIAFGLSVAVQESDRLIGWAT